VDQVIFASDDVSLHTIFKMLPDLNALGTKIKLVPGNLTFIIGKSSVDNLQEVQLIDMDYQLFHPLNRLLKRMMDILAGIIMLLLLRPVQVLLAAAKGIKSYEFVRGELRVRAYDSHGRWNLFWERLPSLRSVLTGRFSLVGAPLDMESRPRGIPAGLISLEELRSKKRLSADERLSLLNYYIHNQSILLDLEIIIKAMMGK
jgi:lipopolysaccharide/colanic/teichoic acid biosynthesis glycosyltransferase